MPPEEIGLRSIFETRDFQAGLQVYLAGLAEAVAATQRASATLGTALTGVGSQIDSGLVAQIQQVARATTQAQAAQANATVQQERSAQALLRTEQARATLQIRQAQAERSLIQVQTAQNQQAAQSAQAAVRLQSQQANLTNAQARATRAQAAAQAAQSTQQASASRAQIAATNAQIAAQNRLVQQATGNLRVQVSSAQLSAAQAKQQQAQTNAQTAAQKQQQQAQQAALRVQQQNLTISNQQTAAAQKLAAAQAKAQQQSAQAGVRQQTLQANLAAAQTRAATATAILNNALNQSNNAAQSASRGMQGLTTRSIALGTAIGITAVNAIKQFLAGLRSLTQEGIEDVTFFERFRLSIQFFEARSLTAKDSTLKLADALTQTQNAGEGMLQFLQRLAILSPFTTKDVAQVFRVAQGYGLLADQAKILIPLLLDFGAATGLDVRTLENAARALGQVQAIGRLTGEEIRQLGNAGIPIRDLLNKTLGTTNEEFNKLLESGSLTADIVIPAITRELEQFAGAGQKVAIETIGGLLSVFQEIKSLGIARLFEGIFQPLKKEFQDLAEVLNDNRTIAIFRVIGENIGRFIGQAINFTRDAINGLIRAWQDLDPQMRTAIINFGLAFTGIVALVGVLGLLTGALQLLFSPFVVITASLALFIADYTTGFGLIQRITTSFAEFLGKTLADAADAFGLIPKAVDETTGQSMDLLGNFGSAVADFLGNLGNLIAKALNGIANFFGSFLNAFTGQAAELSRQSVDITPSVNVDPKTTTTDLNAALIKQAKDAARSQTLDEEMESFGLRAATKFKGGFEQVLATGDFFAPDVGSNLQQESKTEVDPASQGAGLSAGESYVDGFAKNLPKLNNVVSEEVQKVLDKIAGDFPRLTLAGSQAINSFIGGFTDADFSQLDSIVGDITNIIQSAGKLSGASDQNIIRNIFGTREQIASALAELRQFGRISEQTFADIGGSGTFAAQATEELLRAYARLAPITTSVEQSQKNLNDITERYKLILAPVRKELEAIQAIRQGLSEDRELRNLQRVVNNLTFSDQRRKEAQANIDEILAQRRVRSLEQEQTAATEGAQKILDADEKNRAEAQKALDLVRARISAQQQQLDLVAQEAEIFKKLNEELAKAHEKDLTDLERQQKIAELRTQEISDRVKEAKAAHTLNDANASLLEKEQARQDLLEIGVDRQQRLEEAAKLGLADPTVLTSLRTLAVTLDDIGIKQKDVLEPEFDPNSGALPDTVKLSQEWEQTLINVRTRFDEIKGSILATFTELNDNLPEFLKFTPQKEGEEAPIVRTLKGIAIGIGLIVAASTTGAFVTLLTSIASGFTAIGTALGIGAGGAAVGAAPILLALATFAGLVALASQGLPAFNDDIERFERALDRISKIKLPAWFTNFIDFITTPAPEAGAGGKFDLVTHLPIQTEPSQQQKGEVRQAADNLFNVFVNEANELAGKVGLGLLINPLVGSTFTVAPGLVGDIDDIGQFIGTTWNEGIVTGVEQTQNPVLKAIGDLVLAIAGAGKDKAEAHSPSGLTKREIGIPLAEGIAAGFTDSVGLVTDAVAVYTQDFVDFFAATKASWIAFRDDLTEQATGLVTAISVQMDNLNLLVLPKILTFHQAVTDEFAAMNNDIAVITLSIIGNVQVMANSLSGTLTQIGEQVVSRISPTQSNGVPSVVNNTSRNNTFQLNVTTSVPSQGVIGDFTIMQVMASGI